MRRVLVAALFIAMATSTKHARASDALNSSDQGETKEAAKNPPDGKTEVNVVPVVGGSTDVGIGGGVFAGIARVKKGYDPYVWNLEGAANDHLQAEAERSR